MNPDDYATYLKTVDWTNPQQVHAAQQVCADDPTLYNLYAAANPQTSRPLTTDDIFEDVVDPYDF
jgi:hypothetical protein